MLQSLGGVSYQNDNLSAPSGYFFRCYLGFYSLFLLNFILVDRIVIWKVGAISSKSKEINKWTSKEKHKLSHSVCGGLENLSLILNCVFLRSTWLLLHPVGKVASWPRPSFPKGQKDTSNSYQNTYWDT